MWKTNGTSIYYDGGFVGIGKKDPNTSLDVEGGIRPGGETVVSSCTTTTEGTQRYNYSKHVMEYCSCPSTCSWVGPNPPSTAPPSLPKGSWCGLAYVQASQGIEGTGAAIANILLNDAEPLQGTAGTAVNCENLSPLYGCPAGYTHLRFSAISWTVIQSPGSFITCIKN
ncbi:MAG: hypothetical protein AB7G93_07070 [Bdellovibrionales bacterium]